MIKFGSSICKSELSGWVVRHVAPAHPRTPRHQRVEHKNLERAQVRSVAEPEDAARRWRQVLGAHPGSLRLWQEYLAFRRASFPTFGATGIRRDFEDALEVGALTGTGT